jgi:hypothetical protein
MAWVRRTLALLLLLLMVLPAVAIVPQSSGESTNRFATGSTEQQLAFGIGGDTKGTSLSLPGNAYVKSAAMTVTGFEEDANQSISQDAPTALAEASGTDNITINNGRLTMTTGQDAWVKDEESEFEGDALENLTIRDGVVLDRDWNATPSVMMSDFAVYMGPESQWYPAMASDSNNTIMVTWVDGRKGNFDYDLYAKRFGPDGNIVGNEIEVSSAGGPKWYPSIAADSNNGFVVAWHQVTGSYRDIYARRFGPDGQPLGSEFIVCAQSFDQAYPGVAVNSRDEFMVVWEDYRSGTSADIYARLFHSNGTAAGNELAVSTGTCWERSPEVAALPGGDFEIVWSDNSSGEYDIYAVAYDADAGQLGSRFDVCTAAGNQTQPAIAPGKGAEYDTVITWVDDNSGWNNVHARRFDIGGWPIGKEVVANQSQNNQGEPSIAVDSLENFILTWHTYDNFYQTIRARGFGWDGRPLGAELLVCNVSGAQSDPVIAVGNDDRFMLAWNDGRSMSGSDDVFGRLYSRFGPYFRTGTITSKPYGTIPQRPFRITMNFSCDQPQFTSAQGWLRASEDGSTWSVWEIVPKGGSAGCNGRILQWRICLATSRPSRDTPRLVNVTVSYIYYEPVAQILSAPHPAKHNISEATVDLDTTMAEQICIYLSDDNGTSWLKTSDGKPAKFPKPGMWLSYRLVLASEGNETPAVLGIFVSLVINSYPVDLAVDVGGDGSVELFRSGPFTDSTRLDFTEGLVRSMAARQPAGTANIAIIVNISSAGLGKVVLSGLAIDYSINHRPSLGLRQPSDKGIVHEDHAFLVWTGQDEEGSELRYELYLDDRDGSTMLNADLTASTYALGGLTDGAYFWKVRAFDGLEWNSTDVWSFIVKIDTAEPQITSTPPLRAVVGMEYRYDVNAIDSDGDRLDYSLASAPAGMVIDPRNGLVRWTPAVGQAGSRDVLVNVSDGFFNVTQRFVIEVLPELPRPSCTITYPSEGAAVRGKITIRGVAIRAENPIANVEIAIDGKGWISVSGNASWQHQFDTGGLANGIHTLQARAFDGQQYSNLTQLTFNVDNHSGGDTGFTIPVLPMVLVAVFSVAGAAVLYFWKRKRQ